MPSARNTEPLTSRRNTTVAVALWVLGIAALLELGFAAVALTARGFSARPASPDLSASAGTPASTPPQAIAPPQRPLTDSSLVRESLGDKVSEPPYRPAASENQVQGGAALGIVSTKLEGTDEGSKRLLVTIKSRPKESIDVPQVKVQVYFYDDDGNEVSASKAQVTSNWLSAPVDWKDREPELLEVRYLPDSADPSLHFAGYVVAVYYKGDLQDYRAEPARLIKLFPLKYFIGTDEP